MILAAWKSSQLVSTAAFQHYWCTVSVEIGDKGGFVAGRTVVGPLGTWANFLAALQTSPVTLGESFNLSRASAPSPSIPRG